jgi:lipoprotein-anchoring transpeptidase ErfK/SrfK
LSGQHHRSGGNRPDRTLAAKSLTSGTQWARRIALMAAAALFAVPDSASAQGFWNWGPADYQDMRPAPRAKRAKIKRKPDPAEAQAKNAAKPVGPLVIAVSIEKQRVKVYDANGLFAEAPVSTGTKTHPTPMGVFSIIQKNRHHVSNLYAASMPYMQRITWSGVAMHTGPLPGYAASHGCIRLPNEFAAKMWTWTKMGTRVIVSSSEMAPPKDFSHPKLVNKMVPLPTVSSGPAASPVTALAAPPTADAVQKRTADASEAIAGMKGTLTDAGHGAPSDPKVNEAKTAENTPAEPMAAPVPSQAETTSVEPAAATEQQPSVAAASGQDADARTEAMPVKTAAKDELAVKPEDRDNNDDSEAAAAPAEPAQKAEEKPAEPKATAVPVEPKPAQPVLDIAKPADIMKLTQAAKPAEVVKPADAAKPADIAAPTAAPEPAKPVVTVAPRRYNHVAVFISRKEKKLYVRHGYEPVFDTPIEIADADRPLGTHIFTARGDKDDATALHWSVVSPPVIARGKTEPKRSSRQTAKPAPAPVQVHIPMPGAAEALDRITIPSEAMEKIASIITPGGSLLISDYGLTAWETGKGTDFIVPLRQ